MSRWTGRWADFTCLKCHREWKDLYYSPGDTMAYLEQLGADKRFTDSNHRASTCTCGESHTSIRIRHSDGSTAQVRASQRAVIYEHADGSWEAPGSNDPMDSVAQRAAQDGAVRREFHSVHEMESYFAARASQVGLHRDDLSAPSNEILDFDEGSRKREDTITRSRFATRKREAKLREAFSLLRVAGNGGRYDRALRDRDRGGGR